MKFFLKTIVYVLLLTQIAVAQDGAGTADITTKDNFWSRTSKGQQVVYLGADLLLVVWAHQKWDVREYKIAKMRSAAQQEKLNTLNTAYEKAKAQKDLDETELKELGAERSGLQVTLKDQRALIDKAQGDVDKAQATLLFSEKEAQLRTVKARIHAILGEGVPLTGEIHSIDDLHAQLPTASQQEFKDLLTRNNTVTRMPDVDSAGKKEMERAAQENLTLAKRSFDATQNRIDQLNKQIAADTVELQKLTPQVVEKSNALESQRALTNAATAEEHAILAKSGKVIRALKWARVGAYIYAVADPLGRVLYLEAMNQDPGMFPVFRLLHVY